MGPDFCAADANDLPTEPELVDQAPEQLTPVPHLFTDLEALHTLTLSQEPPLCFVRTDKILVALYGGGDASGGGFGGAMPTKDGLLVRHGICGSDAKDGSSNYQEFHNLVEQVQVGAHNGGLHGVELFLYTDNMTAEAAYFKGLPGNKRLDELVVQLKRLESEGGMRVHFLHIAGTHMIKLGIDGLSHGSLTEGFMKYPALLASVPFHLSAFKRVSNLSLLKWFQDWMGTPHGFKPLCKEEWFVEGQGLLSEGDGSDLLWMPQESTLKSFLWAPPPAAADVAIKEL